AGGFRRHRPRGSQRSVLAFARRRRADGRRRLCPVAASLWLVAGTACAHADHGGDITPHLPFRPGDQAMNFNELPFDDKAMLQGLRKWVECESPTYDAAAVDRCMDIAAADLAAAGARVDRIAGTLGFGGCVRA